MKRYALIKEKIAAVQHPDGDAMVVPGYDDDYTEDHPLVRAYPWMFREEGTVPEEKRSRDSVEIPRIERATRAPGEVRDGEHATTVVPRKAGRPRRNPDGVKPDGWGE